LILVQDEEDEEDFGTVILDTQELVNRNEQITGAPEIPVILEEPADDSITMMLDEPQEEPPTATLTCTGGPHIGDVFTLSSGISTVGRSSDNVVPLSSDKEISRHHAILLYESGQFVIQDQNSLNGTYVNNEQISGPHYLKSGDMILVGVSYLKFEQ